MKYWLLKSDPDTYGWRDLVRDGKTRWDGVRNFQVRNFLRAMQVGDEVLFYHSQSDRAIVGTAIVTRAAYTDPTAKEGDWSCVDIRPVSAWKDPVTLAQMRAVPGLNNLSLIKQGRLSVMPVSLAEWEAIQCLRA